MISRDCVEPLSEDSARVSYAGVEPQKDHFALEERNRVFFYFIRAVVTLTGNRFMTQISQH